MKENNPEKAGRDEHTLALNKEAEKERTIRQQLTLETLALNLTRPEFKSSRTAIALFLTVPWGIRLYFWFARRNRYLKPFLFYTSLITTTVYLHYTLRHDSLAFMNNDLPSANFLRDITTVENRETDLAPDLEDITREIVARRKRPPN